MIRILSPFVRFVARVPARVQTKLLVAFLTIVALLVITGAGGLRELSGVNERTEELIKLQRKIEAYRQVQHDTTGQLYSVSSALVSSDERTLDSTLRQLNQFGYDVDRLEFVAKDEAELIDQFRRDYNRFIEVVTKVVELIRGGRTAEARETQLQHATPLADQLERLTNQLVNKAEADMVAGIEASKQAYADAQWIVIGFALGSITLALVLGYAISWSLVGPVKEIETRLDEVATGDFTPPRSCRQSRRTRRAGRRRQPHVRGARPFVRAAGIVQQEQVPVPRQHESRAAYAAQCDHRAKRYVGEARGAIRN